MQRTPKLLISLAIIGYAPLTGCPTVTRPPDLQDAGVVDADATAKGCDDDPSLPHCEPISCTADAKECPDGSFVGRDPQNGCQWKPCPEPMACTEDAKVCPDGTVLARDPEDDCRFPECPDEPRSCPADAKECPDGSYLSRDPEDDCRFPECPDEPRLCPADAKECPDGSYLSRDPEDDCRFPECEPEVEQPEPKACDDDARQCPDGSWVTRDPAQDCEFEPCSDSDGCKNPLTGKPDTWVNCFVDPCQTAICAAHPDAQCTANYCGGCHAMFVDDDGEAVACELIACTDDAKQCPDGSFVGRDFQNNCEWLPCP